jgi:hypothetical protein
MAGASPDDEILAHIESISSRTHSDGQQLADVLHSRQWPGGGGDRTEPGAVDWLRRWRPSGPSPELLLCACASGRCLLCN